MSDGVNEIKEKYFFHCNRKRGGTYMTKYGLDFTCSNCGYRYRSLWNIVQTFFRRFLI